MESLKLLAHMLIVGFATLLIVNIVVDYLRLRSQLDEEPSQESKEAHALHKDALMLLASATQVRLVIEELEQQMRRTA